MKLKRNESCSSLKNLLDFVSFDKEKVHFQLVPALYAQLSTHNFQISALALHIKIFPSQPLAIFEKHFLMPIPRISAVMVLCLCMLTKSGRWRKYNMTFQISPCRPTHTKRPLYHVLRRKPSKDTNVHFFFSPDRSQFS